MSAARERPEEILALQRKKAELGLSNQAMADGVLATGRWTTKSVADRIFKPGAEKERFRDDSVDPYIQVYLLEPEPPIPTTMDEAMELRIQLAALQAVAAADLKIREVLQKSIDDKKRAIWFLSIALSVVAAVAIFYFLFFDIRNGSVGLIKY